MWGKSVVPNEVSERRYGKGKIYWGGNLSKSTSSELYPNYDATALLLLKMGIKEDFESTGPIRYTHHCLETGEIYFVSNKTNSTVNTLCKFRTGTGTPKLWDPLTGEIRPLPDFTIPDERMQIPLQFEPYQSFFIVIDKEGKSKKSKSAVVKNFPPLKVLLEVKSPWNVSFDPKWGGPKEVTFHKLEEWTTRPEDGIRYYSGIANYHNTINLPENIVADKKADIFLDLGQVYNLARIHVNGKDMGVVWTAPFQLKITDAVLPGNNRIDIEVANLWPNRLIGDEQLPDDGIKNGEWPVWLVKKQSRTSGRVTFYTAKFYQKDSELLKSGLIGPVRIIVKSHTFNEN
jgi:hypothetical protein